MPFGKTVRSFGESLDSFNSFLNILAYKPNDSRQSFLFYLPWLNHNFNSTYSFQNGGGPVQRSVLMLTCNQSSLAWGFALTREFLPPLFEVANIARPSELPEIKEPASSVNPAFCGPGAKP